MKLLAWVAIGIAAQMTGAGAHSQELVNLNTWFSTSRGDHLTTTAPVWAGTLGEVRPVGGGSGYVMVRQEGQVFSPAAPPPAGTVPLVSFWNPERGDNFITADPRWVGLAGADGYTRVRLEGYVYATPRVGSVPLRNFWSASREDNYATTDPRLRVPLLSTADERTMSVEGGLYTHYRIEGHLPSGNASPAPTRGQLRGLVDMHAHLMSYLGFGKKLLHGAPDAFPDGTFGPPDGIPDGALIPAGTRGCNPADTRASTIAEALGDDNSTHGGRDFFVLDCRDDVRNLTVRVFESANGAHSEHGADKTGWPTFVNWPRFDDLTHQQMWVDWIRRAHANGLRVMVTLAVNNVTMAHLVRGDPPFDDRSAADLQLRETVAFVRRHADFMEIALSAADLRRIVGQGKLAVVLGVELDNLGNFRDPPTREAITAEVLRLRQMGVRYVFPLHLSDNPFGGTAVDEPFFNVMNKVQTGDWWALECSTTVGRPFAIDGGLSLMLSLVPGIGSPPSPPACPPGQGHRNTRGLTAAGRELIDVLMRNAMLIDIDHMSERASDEALAQARDFPSGWGYPLVSGHNGARGGGDGERALRSDQLEAIRDRGGMFGLGWARTDAGVFRNNLRVAHGLMGPGRVAFGTDANGLEKLPARRPGSAVSMPWSTGGRSWDYNTDGVSNYGMLPEFVADLTALDGAVVAATDRANVAAISGAAESFARMWERAELARRTVLSP